MKTIGCMMPINCIFLQSKRIYGFFFGHELVNKIGLDPNLVQETADIERWKLDKDPERSTEVNMKRTKTIKDDRMEETNWLENWNIEDGVIFKGGWMQYPSYIPLNIF